MPPTTRLVHDLQLHSALAVDRLKDGKPGDRVTREQMTDAIGRDVHPGSLGYGNVRTAIDYVLRNYSRVWRWEQAEQAWVCLDDSGAVDYTTSRIRRTRRAARKAMSVAAAVDTSKLTPTEHQRHSVNIAVAGVMQMVGSSQFAKRLVDSRVQEPDPAKIAELMKRI